MTIDHASAEVLIGAGAALVLLVIFARAIVGAIFAWLGL